MAKLSVVVEILAVICETCRARLKVRSTSVIGEIHACPKCGSMVHIRPPASGDSAAVAPVVEQAEVVAPLPEQVAAPEIDLVDVQVPPAVVAATSSSIVLWCVGGAVVLLAGLGAVVWSRGKGADGAPRPVATVVEEKSAAEDAAVSDPYELGPEADAAEDSKKPDELPVEPIAETPPVDVAGPELPAIPDESGDTVAGVSDAADQVVDTRPPSEMVEPVEAPAAEAVEQKSTAVLKFDPLDFDPSRLSLDQAKPSTNAPPTRSIASDVADDIEVVDEAPLDETKVLLPPPTVEQQTLFVRRGPMPSVAGSSDYAQRLAIRVDSLQVTDMPLSELVDVLAEMAGVALTLDPLALELAGVSARAAVSVEGKEKTVEELLDGALSRHRLGVVARAGHVSIGLKDGEQWRTAEYELKDLVRGGEAKEVADLIERFIEPATWQRAGGKGIVVAEGTKLRIEQSQAIHRELIIFCERLRLARGLAPRSRYPSELLSIDSPWNSMQAKLSERTTFTFLPWTPLADVLRHWSNASDVTILVDWSALAEAELGPNSFITCSAIDRSWVEALDGILSPLELTWWPVDGETIQITSRAALDEIWRVEFYALAPSWREKFAGDAAVVAALETELREQHGTGDSELKAISWEIDAPSGRLIVRATPAVHQFLSRRLSAAAGG